MASSSITATFYSDDAKAANTFECLILSERPPKSLGSRFRSARRAHRALPANAAGTRSKTILKS